VKKYICPQKCPTNHKCKSS